MFRHISWAVIAACMLATATADAAAQHEHHGAPTAAAQVAVTGIAQCAEGPVLAGAIVQVYHGTGAQRHVMATTLTDASGRFALRVAAGTYTLEINHLGHAPLQQTVVLAAAPLALGALRMQFSALTLDALTVAAARATVQLRSGATVVDARSAAAAAGGSVGDLLRTVPGIEVNSDGQLAIRGSTSVLVLVNGRRIPLTGDALAAFLRQMPASALERVEATTSASAAQEADGMAGVVNLVFRDDAAQRTPMRSVSASIATRDHYMASAALTGTAGPAIAWDALYSFSGMRPRTDSWTTRFSLLPGDPLHHTSQDSRAQATHRLHSVMTGADWTVTPSVSLGSRATFAWMSGAYRNTTDFLDTGADGSSHTHATRSMLSHVIPSGELGGSLAIGSGPVRFTSELRGSFVDEDFDGTYAHATDAAFLSTTMASRQRQYVISNDVRFGLGGLDIGAGQQSQLRTISADYDVARDAQRAASTFRYEDAVHAGYVTAHRMMGEFHADAGLRVEREDATIRLGDEYRRDALRFFPSLNVQRTAGDMVYRAAYSRRLNRPGSELLNPFSMGEDDMNEIIGNPYLLPEVADQLEVGVERGGALLSLQLTPFLRWTRDPIRPLKAVTESGRSTTTLQNLTRTVAAGSDASIRARVTDDATITLAGSVYHMDTQGAEYSSSGLFTSARLNLDVRVRPGTTAQLYAFRRSAQAVEQGRILPSYTSELSVTQSFAEDRGRVTLRLIDPLRSDRLEFRIGDHTFTQESSRRTERPLLSLFASWAVGGAPKEDAPVRSEAPARIF